MTSFTATGTLTTQQVLASGEVGFVTPNGAVLTTAGNAISMTGAASLTVFGSVASGNATAISGTGLSNSHISVMAGGAVSGSAGSGVLASVSGLFTLANAGQVTGTRGASLDMTTGSAAVSVANSGTIQAIGTDAIGIYSNSVANSSINIDNTGAIQAVGFFATGLWLAGAGSAVINNSGLISASGSFSVAIFSAPALTLVNSGIILGSVSSSGLTSITTSGQITGSVSLGAQNDTVRVSGLVDGNIDLGNGANRFVLRGGDVTGTVSGGSGVDTYFIDRSDAVIQDFGGSSDIVYSTVDYLMGSGIDVLELVGVRGLRGIGNSANETIYGDVGNDTLIGRGGDDLLSAGDGNNQLFGGSGNDNLRMGEGNDRAEGNAGDDTFAGSLGTDTIKGGLGVDLLILSALGATGTVVNLTTGRGVMDGVSTSQISGIENIVGSVGNDLFTGDAANNRIEGISGDDTILGGNGADTLVGGAGADVLTGGLGADVFVYSAVSHSVLASGIDRIAGFSNTADLIDLSLIDAVAGGTDDAFVFVGTAAFAGAGAQLRYVRDNLAGTTTIELRLGNSGTVDLTIILDAAINLAVDDFVL